MASILYEEKAICPACHELSNFLAYRFIDSSTDPQLVDMLLDNSLFAWKCPECDDTRVVYYDCTVYNPSLHYLITLDSETEDRTLSLSQEQKAFQDLSRLRLAHNMSELKEKLTLFSDGLDDIAMEAYKGFLLATMEGVNEADQPTHFFYEYTDEDRFFLRAFHNDQMLGLFAVPQNVYHSIQTDIVSITKNIPDVMLMYVDMAYAIKLLEHLPQN